MSIFDQIWQSFTRWRKPTPAPTPAPVTSYLLPRRGCNLPGGDTPYTSWPYDANGVASPVNGSSYLFVSNAEVDGLLAAGMNTFRLLFTWEALQTSAYASITGNTGNFKIYADKLFALVDYITSKGAEVILDIHPGIDADFAAYRGVKVGSSYNGDAVGDMLENLWWQLARKYAGNPRVLYGIANEPHDLSPTVWFAWAQKFVNGIRAAGATSAIVMPGVAWTGASTWVSSGNAAAWDIIDPLNNTLVQLHLYMDAYAGGGSTDVVSSTIAVDRLKGAVTWARSKGLKIFLGEVGCTAAQGTAAWNNLVTFMVANQDVCNGFTFWACGPKTWWSGYRFYCGVGSPQLAMIQGALK